LSANSITLSEHWIDGGSCRRILLVGLHRQSNFDLNHFAREKSWTRQSSAEIAAPSIIDRLAAHAAIAAAWGIDKETKSVVDQLMKERAIWFVLGAAFAPIFWLAFMVGLGQEWLHLLPAPGRKKSSKSS
jgi:hypothetical protein